MLAKKSDPKYYNDFDDEDSHCEIASELLKRIIGIDINQPNAKNKTALMIAAERGHLDLVQLFIELGANKNIRNTNGKTAAQLANENDHNTVVQFLRQKKARLL